MDLEIYVGTGKYGPYVKIQDDNNKWKYASIKNVDINDVTLEDAIKLLEYPKTLGKIGNKIVTLNKGQYGLYFKCGDKNYSIKNTEIEPASITLEYAREMIESGDPYALRTFKVKDKVINIKNGEYGHYIQIINGTKKQFINIPSSYNIEKMNIDDVLKIIAAKNGTTKGQTEKPKNKKPKDFEV